MGYRQPQPLDLFAPHHWEYLPKLFAAGVPSWTLLPFPFPSPWWGSAGSLDPSCLYLYCRHDGEEKGKGSSSGRHPRRAAQEATPAAKVLASILKSCLLSDVELIALGVTAVSYPAYLLPGTPTP